MPDSDSVFDDRFRGDLGRLFAWRRDVRRFSPGAVDETLLDHLLDEAQLAPSVGNSQPWRWVRVESAAARGLVRQSFMRCNADALAGYSGDRARLYASLKLHGLDEAPVQFAVFADQGTAQGLGLGRRTMPETIAYSVVNSIALFWLAARAHGLGLGWVSILEPADVVRSLDVPSDWQLIAYLCVGWPAAEHVEPELSRAGWQNRTGAGRVVVRR